MKIIESERSVFTTVNESADQPSRLNVASRLSHEELVTLLAEREEKLRTGRNLDGITDQWRVYKDITSAIQRGEYLRLIVQADAGTGKSFLLTTVFLWCLVHGFYTKVAAPTGIAAATHDCL